MGNVKIGKRSQKSLLAIVMTAVYSIGFGIMGLTAAVLIFLNIVAEQQLFTPEVFPDIELGIVIGYFLIVIGMIFLFPLLTARKLKKSGAPMVAAIEKIQAQNLDFEIRPSGIKEIDLVLDSMEEMRLALKESLTTQWRLEKNRKDQISALAHDFKTPITVLKGNIELLNISDLDDAEKDYLDDAKTSLSQIELYLEQLLDMIQVGRGYLINQQTINLGKLINRTAKLLMCIAAEKNITLKTRLEKEQVVISGDSNLINRVLNNLITNALDYTAPNGTIEVCLTTGNGIAVITITDSGCGFCDYGLLHATEQFYMEDDSRSRKNHYGLGLTIADSIIRQHKGKLSLSNDLISGGARIIVEIPLLPE